MSGNESIGELSEKHRRNIGETSEKVKLLSEDNRLSAVKLAEKIGIAGRNIESNIKTLKDCGILVRHGSPKNGYWEIVDEGEKD